MASQLLNGAVLVGSYSKDSFRIWCYLSAAGVLHKTRVDIHHFRSLLDHQQFRFALNLHDNLGATATVPAPDNGRRFPYCLFECSDSCVSTLSRDLSLAHFQVISDH